MGDALTTRTAWEFQHWSNPALKGLIEDEFRTTDERALAWKVIAALNARYPGAWELLRGELQYREKTEE